jgi:hypothetical protein
VGRERHFEKSGAIRCKAHSRVEENSAMTDSENNASAQKRNPKSKFPGDVRHGKDLCDVDGLAENIKKLGHLLQLIVVLVEVGL